MTIPSHSLKWPSQWEASGKACRVPSSAAPTHRSLEIESAMSTDRLTFAVLPPPREVVQLCERYLTRGYVDALVFDSAQHWFSPKYRGNASSIALTLVLPRLTKQDDLSLGEDQGGGDDGLSFTQIPPTLILPHGGGRKSSGKHVGCRADAPLFEKLNPRCQPIGWRRPFCLPLDGGGLRWG